MHITLILMTSYVDNFCPNDELCKFIMTTSYADKYFPNDKLCT
jgi:hypothetical protein